MKILRGYTHTVTATHKNIYSYTYTQRHKQTKRHRDIV